jgi:hypothetical protein
MVRHFFNRLNQNLKRAAVTVAALLFFSCGKPPAGKVYLLGESRVVSGLLGAQQGVDLKTVKISLIDLQGQRTTPYELKYDGAQGSFSFQLRDADLHETKKATALDRILSMGNALPAVVAAGSDLVARADKYTRIEMMQSTLASSDYQVIPYFQGILPISRKNLMAGKDVIGIGGQIKFAKAGFVRVKVVNESGTPLQGIKVAGIAQTVSVNDGIVFPNSNLWHEAQLRPVYETTDANGQAYIGPVDASEELTRYQILATGTGYCTYLSSPTNNFSLSEKSAPVVTLRACEKTETSVNDLVASFPEKLKYLDIDNRKIVHTKDDFITVRLDSKTENLRGARLALYETDSNFQPSLEVTGKVIESQTFQGEYILELPKLFKTGGTEGKFIVKVSRLAGNRQGVETSAQDFPELNIYGHRKIFTPSRDLLMKTQSTEVENNLRDSTGIADVDFWSNFKIASVSGTTNIVPGLAGGKFTMTSSACGLGDSLGFTVSVYGINTPVFKECVNGVATFTAEEAGFVNNSKVTTAGPRQIWKIFIKDKFGNVSESLDDPDAASPKRLNVMTVIVDIAPPIRGDNPTNKLDLSNLKFYKDATELNANPYIGKWLRPADLEDEALTMGFKKETGNINHTTCLQVASDESGSPDSVEKERNGGKGGNATLLGGTFSHFVFKDEFGRLNIKAGTYEDVGLMIYKWMIGGSSAGVTEAAETSYTRCRSSAGSGTEPVEPVERKLKVGDIVFPDDPSSEAVFYMRYMDAAGLLSNAIKYTIPACTALGNTFCWRDAAWGTPF